MAQTAQTNSARAAALARRQAMSTTGKATLGGSGSRPTRSAGGATAAPTPKAAPKVAASSAGRNQAGARAASMARRVAMSTRGKAAVPSSDRTRSDTKTATSNPARPAAAAPTKAAGDCGCGCKDGERAEARKPEIPEVSSAPTPKIRQPIRRAATTNPGRSASLARRRALSSRGKAGLGPNGISSAQAARAGNPKLSARELAQTVRAQRSRNGGAGQKKTAPTGRVRPAKAEAGAAQDAGWKVGASETSHGQTVTGTMVGRNRRVTGDEPSTCRTITGTEYLGADIFRDFCQTEPAKGPRKVGLSPTSRGSGVTGTEVGRSTRVTGDEPGTCKRVTGTEYVGAGQSQAFCGTGTEAGPSKITGSETRKGKSVTGNNVGRSSKVTGDEPGAARELTGTQYMSVGNGAYPAKVGASRTLRGGAVTGTLVGRSGRVTGDEPGSCRNVTGDDYVGQEQYNGFCEKIPTPQDAKVGLSSTLKGKSVTGTLTGRSERVTGDEPGTCKAITGTPYAGAEQYAGYCAPEDSTLAAARTRRLRSTPGSVMTGQQPGINGTLTGAEKGACEPVTGTPYVGADQYAAACPASPAEPGSPDFPQPIGGTPWGAFSVSAPAHAAQAGDQPGGITGTRYEQGQITGPFGKAEGRVTGTEEARFGRREGAAVPATPAPAEAVEGRIKSRITGEGMDTGLRITGDDWDRGDRVTGTEGTSAMGRNPSRRGGPISAMPSMQTPKRNESVPEPQSKVTGSSGNTEKGSLVTYSGGARG